MKRKIKIVALMIMLFMALAVGSYSTYAFLTETKTVTNSFTVGEINGEVIVTGNAEVDSKIVNGDLAYIHHIDDFVKNKYELLDTMASQLKISITSNNSYACRVKVKLPNLDELKGLIYIVIDDTKDTKDLPVSLQIAKTTDADGNVTKAMLQYGYVKTDGTVTYNDLIEVTTLYNLEITDDNFTDSNNTLRELVQNYNYNKLSTLYTDESNIFTSSKSMYFRVLMWGDYYSLTDTTDYLKETFSFKVTAKVIQAIDQTTQGKEQGGKPNYDED